MTKVKIDTLKMVIKQAIKDGGFTFQRKSYVILTSDKYHELNNAALSYSRIKEFVSSK